MRIHAIQTGTVQVKQSQRIGKGAIRQLNVLLDSQWTEPLPIYAWVIETDEGVIIVDTGETARTSQLGYFPLWHPYFWLAARFDVKPEQEIGRQLSGIGIRPEDVRKVIITHLHTDHAGGLHDFPKSEIFVTDEELGLARGFGGRLRGYLPNRWPSWFAPRAINFQPTRVGAFERSCPVTRDGGVLIVPTFGHTPGHVSVIVAGGDVSFFLAGDTTYDQQALLEQKVDGVSPNKLETLQTMRKILDHVSHSPTVYLPSHDPDSKRRLSVSETVPVPKEGRADSKSGHVPLMPV